jgi:hypothetical protein
VIKKIEDSHADNIYIVGHSSGCAIANKVNSLLKGDHKNITLVDLDGFAPSGDQKRGQPFKPGLLREMAAGVTP